MVPMGTRDAFSHIGAVSDKARARELYEYYQPKPSHNGQRTSLVVNSDSAKSTDKIASADTALTAFCQLVAWRTGAQRALLSLVDDTAQYFIAEGSKTVDLVDTSKHAPGDEIWIGCSSIAKSGMLCMKTLEVAPTKGGEYPSFVVEDLTLHEQYSQLPFVAGPPFLKFYASVPLITKRGIPIGTLMAVDQNPRAALSKENIHFMGTMANTIMRHIDMAREVEEHRRGMKMSRGLAAFVEGRAELIEAEVDAPGGEGTKIAGQFETDAGLANGRTKPKATSGPVPWRAHSATSSTGSIERKEREYSDALVKTERDIIFSQDPPPTHRAPDSGSLSLGGTSESVHSPAIELDTHDNTAETPSTKTLFSRAANLIRETFEIDGGCVFFDAQKGFNLVPKPSIPPALSRQVSLLPDGSGLASLDKDLSHENTIPSQPDPTPSDPGEGLFSRSASDSRKAVEILAFSTTTSASINGDEYPVPGSGPQSFIPFHQKALQTLLQRYPRGKLWTLVSDIEIVLSSDEIEALHYDENPEQHMKNVEKRNMKKARMRSDAKFLSRHFPGVRQLLFVPLWDSGRSRWLSGCCVWSTEPTRILSKQVELAFLTGFGNSVMAECSRIDTEIANQKKGDFIGSISHELRSPLHGILASAEFLGEERLGAFVKGLVETINSCSRTLLDTINHILDFSKINNFEKTWQKNRRGGAQGGTRYDGTVALQQSDVPMMNLFAEVDIAVVCEEVVESVFAGHVFQNITAQTFDMVPGAQRKMADVVGFGADAGSLPEHVKLSQVAVILDVKMRNFNFTTQPGAFRRVIMNLLGNALKYTSHGYVHVTLEATEPEKSLDPNAAPRSIVTLTVADTGKGISSEFLRSKLFTPFTQENSLSSGTGLGLAIVKSIVSLLEGEIAIDSEVGRGTKVKVTLPLLRELPNLSDSASPKSITSLSRNNDQSIAELRSRVIGQTVSLHGFELDTPDPLARQVGQLLKESITTFVTEWYGLRVIPPTQNANIIISNEVAPTTTSSLTYQVSTQQKSPTVLVLSSHASRFSRTIPTNTVTKSIGFVAKPVGPLKLARALVQCLDGVPPVVTPSTLEPHPPAEGAGLNKVFEDLSPTPNMAEVLDNSRMSSDSNNARKAIESPVSGPEGTCMEFPFPIETPVSKPKSTLPERRAPGLEVPSSESLVDPEATPKSPVAPSLISKPRLLLVDDNIINLTLLRTYMRKRKYDFVDEAENGLEAINRFSERSDGYDIIFMDISMPILDGFGASRQIRAIEASRRNAAAKAQSPSATAPEGSTGQDTGTAAKRSERTPALIIALTGLASTQDQREALSSGIDLFLTKPVAFKEVGKLLDNWEANR